MASVAEEFSIGRLLDYTRPHVPERPLFMSALWEDSERSASMTWNGQIMAWKQWHGIELEKAACWKRFDALTTARNTIVHGLGRLTPPQLGRDGGKKVLTRLAHLEIRCIGTTLVLDSAALSRCTIVALEYIEWLDTEVGSRGLPA